MTEIATLQEMQSLLREVRRYQDRLEQENTRLRAENARLKELLRIPQTFNMADYTNNLLASVAALQGVTE